MIKTVANNIKFTMDQLGYYDQIFPWVTMITVDGITAPRYYDGDGMIQNIMDFEKGGLGYLRKNGKTSFVELENESFTSCVTDEYLHQITLPVRIVSAIRRDVFQCDDAFVDEYHVNELIGVLSGKPSGLAVELSARSVRYKPTTTVAEPQTVWNEETTDSGYKVPQWLSLVALDMNVVVVIDSECLQNVCGY